MTFPQGGKRLCSQNYSKSSIKSIDGIQTGCQCQLSFHPSKPSLSYNEGLYQQDQLLDSPLATLHGGANVDGFTVIHKYISVHGYTQHQQINKIF